MSVREPVAWPNARVSLARYLGATGTALWGLMVALQPDPGFQAPWLWMALFWGLQVSMGIAVLQSVLYLMSRNARVNRWPLWLVVVSSGVMGAGVLAPVYWLIGEALMQGVLGFPQTLDADESPVVPLTFGLQVLVQEFGDIVGPVTAAWVLISWPRLQGLLPPLVYPAQIQVGPERPPLAQEPPSMGGPSPAWRTLLPEELGDDLMAVTSELQYLRVWTTRGSALVLGALQTVEESEGGAGMRVHRSWWVHARHVRRVRVGAGAAVCELSDGREVPVSRRRKADVLARFGDGARYQTTATTPAATSDDCDQNIRRNPT
jgi:hypothetical protein